jgi:hypothetical protein
MEEMIINGKTYVEKTNQVVLNNPTEIKIVVLQRGWVLVGRFEKDGTNCKLHDASTIRSWGTTKGLGEIALGGPTLSTKLDKCNGLVEFDILTVVLMISVKEEKWKTQL